MNPIGAMERLLRALDLAGRRFEVVPPPPDNPHQEAAVFGRGGDLTLWTSQDRHEALIQGTMNVRPLGNEACQFVARQRRHSNSPLWLKAATGRTLDCGRLEFMWLFPNSSVAEGYPSRMFIRNYADVMPNLAPWFSINFKGSAPGRIEAKGWAQEPHNPYPGERPRRSRVIARVIRQESAKPLLFLRQREGDPMEPMARLMGETFSEERSGLLVDLPFFPGRTEEGEYDLVAGYLRASAIKVWVTDEDVDDRLLGTPPGESMKLLG